MAGDETDSSTTTASSNGHLGHDEELMLESASASTSSSGSMKRSTTTPLQRQASCGLTRAPDMQLGRCRWIRVYDNVTYIVVGIVLRETEDGKVEMLLIQEAKKKCRGKWYIPAGHVEPGETVDNAVKRELQEETGYEGNVEHLLCVEVKGSGWYRMTYVCEVTGGQLKTEPDQESLGAEWFDVDKIRNGQVNLRSNDFFKLINEALRYREWRISVPRNDHFKPILNADVTQPGLFIEYVIVKQSVISNKIEVLVHSSIESEEQLLGDMHGGFPTVEFGFEYFFPMVVSKCYRHILVDGHTTIDIPRAVLGTWCLPSPIDSLHHGLKIRLLCPHKKTTKAPIIDPRRYYWLELTDQKVLEELCILPDQFQPALYML